MNRVRVFEDLEALSLATAEALAAQIRTAINERGRCAFVLTGGRTPRRMYELLGERFSDAIPWPLVDLFWGDERYVPHDHAQSNYRMARESLIDRVPVPPENIHPMPTYDGDPQRGAEAYERLLRDYFGDRSPQFDVLLLGVAANGHVASLFPHQAALHEQTRWVIAADVPADPPHRITMTYVVINQARQVAFLVAGPAKANAVAQALQPGADIDEAPAAGVAPTSGGVTWWLDAAAAAQIRPSRPLHGGDGADPAV